MNSILNCMVFHYEPATWFVILSLGEWLWDGLGSRAETNTRFAHIFARLHNYSNTMKVFGYTTYDFGVVILAYFIYSKLL